MQTITLSSGVGRDTFYRWANALALITVFYNLGEGMVSVFLGFEDGTVALFGFGVDSFVEVLSGVGIWHMIRRMRRNGAVSPDKFERTALKITGAAFYVLTLALTATALINIVKGHKPETTFWGVVISIISILSMWFLMHYKLKVGRRFGSEALMADAHCTRTCIYLSVVLLVASIGY